MLNGIHPWLIEKNYSLDNSSDFHTSTVEIDYNSRVFVVVVRKKNSSNMDSHNLTNCKSPLSSVVQTIASLEVEVEAELYLAND